jgi:hypothetical protein
MEKVALSILIPSTPDRRDTLACILRELHAQALEMRYEIDKDFEIIILEDNREISVGKKRQMLLEMAKGDFVVGIDSDDFIAPTYLQDIISAIRLRGNDIDHIGFYERCNIDGELSRSIFSIKHQKWGENTDGFDHVRCANPKSVIKRSIALSVGYEDLRYGEDRIFSESVTPQLFNEYMIEKELYYYNYVSTPHIDRYGLNAK